MQSNMREIFDQNPLNLYLVLHISNLGYKVFRVSLEDSFI